MMMKLLDYEDVKTKVTTELPIDKKKSKKPFIRKHKPKTHAN